MATYADIDATLSGVDSNSYVTGAEQDAFAGLQSWGDAWLAKTESERTIAIVQACRWLETVDYGGSRCTTTQALAWPRSGATCDSVEAVCTMIPKGVKTAQMLLAYQLVVNPDAITGAPGGGGGAAAGTYVSKNQLGDLVQEFSEYSGDAGSGSDCTDCSNPEVINKFPWLQDYLQCWADIVTPGGSRVLLRVRS